MSKEAPVARGNRKDLVNTGHGCTGITNTLVCSSDVFVNSIGAVRIGDACLGHTIDVGPECLPCGPVLNESSIKVFVNGRGLGRVGDAYHKHRIITGADNVFAG